MKKKNARIAMEKEQLMTLRAGRKEYKKLI